jgi:membrane protease YdiL (CAAX protease family)
MSAEPHKRGPRVSEADAILLGAGIIFLIFLVDGLFKEWLYRNAVSLYWAFDIAKFVIVPALILAWLYRRHSLSPSRYGLERFGKGEHWFHALGLILLVSLILAVVYHLSSRMAWSIAATAPPTFTYSNSVPSGWLHFPVVVYFGLTAGFVEEVFLRGLPVRYLQCRHGDHWSRPAYVAGTSLLFGLIHWENGIPEIFATAAFGVAAAVIYLKLRNLWPLIMAHILIDVWWFS